MRRNSLAFRLIAAASLWSAAALLAAGLILTSLYGGAVERAFDERLSVYLRTLIGSLAQQSPPASTDPGNLGEPRFELTYSGWYWQVRDAKGTVLLASRSLFTDLLDVAKATNTRDLSGVTSGALVGPDDQSLRVVSRTVDFDDSHRYEVLVAGDAGEVADQISQFRWQVFLTLGVLGIGLVIATTAQIRWGLRPLDNVRRGLAALRSGKEARFEGPFPAEIEPLARELNALLQSNQEIIERARTQVGNLAHALKTPLSVITNEARAASGPLAGKVAEQAELMRTQVNHYLERARIAARAKVIGAATDVEPVVASLVRAMKRIHEDRHVRIAVAVADGALFRGEKQDLEEIVGNLVDNACKWARTTVSVGVAFTPRAGEDAPGRLILTIDDDGPGLTAAERDEVTRRGRRLDETKPGSGLGLSIVTELVTLYEGALQARRVAVRRPAGRGGIARGVRENLNSAIVETERFAGRHDWAEGPRRRLDEARVDVCGDLGGRAGARRLHQDRWQLGAGARLRPRRGGQRRDYRAQRLGAEEGRRGGIPGARIRAGRRSRRLARRRDPWRGHAGAALPGQRL